MSLHNSGQPSQTQLVVRSHILAVASHDIMLHSPGSDVLVPVRVNAVNVRDLIVSTALLEPLSSADGRGLELVRRQQVTGKEVIHGISNVDILALDVQDLQLSVYYLHHVALRRPDGASCARPFLPSSTP